MPLTVRQLRSRWRPHKLRLQAVEEHHPTPIRFHRACSWLAQAQTALAAKDVDAALLHGWIAFNALYGRWNSDAREPVADRRSWQEFSDRMVKLDRDRMLSRLLVNERKAITALFEDQYLSDYFWEEPTEQRARQSRKVKFDAAAWYSEKRWALLLEHVLRRIYFLRCQLVHGASTYGGKLNRGALRQCTALLEQILTTFLAIFADHGADEDWGALCYPPMGK
jgi:hypothetical protein